VTITLIRPEVLILWAKIVYKYLTLGHTREGVDCPVPFSIDALENQLL